jgi:NTE family protein
VPFAAVTMDTATGRAHPIRHGPLLPALPASAAIPGVYPPVHPDRPLLPHDGGLVANVPMRVAVEMGGRSLVVLDCAFPGQFPAPPETPAEILLYTRMITMRTPAVYEAPLVAREIPVVYLPGPAARLVSPPDF